jgi:non-heme chloroperoxidase
MIIFVVGLIVALLLSFPPNKTIPYALFESLPKLIIDYDSLPEPSSYKTRDGATLPYRFYDSNSKVALILIHGGSVDGRYFHSLARFVSGMGIAQVYVPDLRGYGEKPERRGDVTYIGQTVDDLADLLAIIRQNSSTSKVIMGGHSAGGGTALKFAESSYSTKVDGYLLLAPAVGMGAPTERKPNEASGVSRISIPRLAGLTLLNVLGIRIFNHLPVVRFNKPIEMLDGSETLVWSFRLALSRIPGAYDTKRLKAIKKPMLVLIGQDDEEFDAQEYPAVFAHCPRSQVRILPKNLASILEGYALTSINLPYRRIARLG